MSVGRAGSVTMFPTPKPLDPVKSAASICGDVTFSQTPGVPVAGGMLALPPDAAPPLAGIPPLLVAPPLAVIPSCPPLAASFPPALAAPGGDCSLPHAVSIGRHATTAPQKAF